MATDELFTHTTKLNRRLIGFNADLAAEATTMQNLARSWAFYYLTSNFPEETVLEYVQEAEHQDGVGYWLQHFYRLPDPNFLSKELHEDVLPFLNGNTIARYVAMQVAKSLNVCEILTPIINAAIADINACDGADDGLNSDGLNFVSRTILEEALRMVVKDFVARRP